MNRLGIGLLCALSAAACAGGDGIDEGLWRGGVSVAGQEIAVDLETGPEGVFFGLPAQGILRLPVNGAVLTKEKVSFLVPLPNGELRFQGAAADDGRISGTFLQDGMRGEFFLEYSGPAPDTTGAAPEPGTDREIFLNPDGAKLYGRLRDLPEGLDGGVWAALIIAGSGPTDGDGNSRLMGSPNNSLLRLANVLAEEGIPSLRFDKRGSGRSVEGIGAEEDTRFTGLIADAEAWYGRLREEYPGRKYVILGHSQGSLIALDLASRLGADAVVSLAGAGFPIGTTLKAQMAAFPPELREAGNAILDELVSGRRVETVPPALQALFRPSVQPFLISYLSYDPAELITRVACPVLIVQGGMDGQVSPAEGENLHAARPDGGYLFLPMMNHLLRDVEDVLENQRTYAEDRLPLSPGLRSGLKSFFTDYPGKSE